MRPSLPACLLAVTVVAATMACSRPADRTQAAPAVAPPSAGSAAGITIDPVPGMRATRDFTAGHLAQDGWKLFAEPGSTGTPLLTMVMDGSNDITAAWLRIGRSTDAAALKSCLQRPAEASGQADTQPIAGVEFTHYRSGDAAMSHYLHADNYRTIRDGACYAIDLIISGTRPEVYDPPRTPPFSQDAAERQLQTALKAVRWTR